MEAIIVVTNPFTVLSSRFAGTVLWGLVLCVCFLFCASISHAQARKKPPVRKKINTRKAPPAAGTSTKAPPGTRLSLRQIYQNARNAYEYGNYKLAIQLYRSLLYPPPGRIKNRNIRKQAHKYLGLAYYFAGPLKPRMRKLAQAEFLRFLELSPTSDLDPALFPPNLVSLFQQVKERNKKKLQAILARQKRMRKRARPPSSRPLPIPLATKTLELNPLLSVLPFGVTQFTNGHRTKGALVLGFEALTLSTNIIAFAVLQSFVETNGPGRGLVPVSLKTPAQVLQVVQYTALGLFGGLLVYGLIDGLYFFRSQRQSVYPLMPQINPDRLRVSSSNASSEVFSFQERFP